jgi:hypothetical protein
VVQVQASSSEKLIRVRLKAGPEPLKLLTVVRPYLPIPIMPITNLEEKRAYQLEWLTRRRETWFSENGPCRRCGSWVDLELHHRDPSAKVTHKVWSWSKTKRDAELAKCDPLCAVCHRSESNKFLSESRKGLPSLLRKLSAIDVHAILHLLSLGIPQRTVAPAFGVSRSVIAHISAGYKYRELLPSRLMVGPGALTA